MRHTLLGRNLQRELSRIVEIMFPSFILLYLNRSNADGKIKISEPGMFNQRRNVLLLRSPESDLIHSGTGKYFSRN